MDIARSGSGGVEGLHRRVRGKKFGRRVECAVKKSEL